MNGGAPARRQGAMGEKIVLLVEDNADIRNIFATALVSEGYTVVEAVNGEEGIRLARAISPRLILMNIALPLVDGWKATAVLKRDPRTKEIPVVAITAFTRSRDRQRARSLGCASYLPKPCEPSRLLEEVRRLIGSAGDELG